MSTNMFKVGDKVRVIEPDILYPVGTTFVVTGVHSNRFGEGWEGYYVTGDNHREGVWIDFIEKVEDAPEPLADWEYELLYGGTGQEEPIFAALLHAYGYPSMGYLISEDSAQYLTEQGPQEGQTWLLTVERDSFSTYAGREFEATVVKAGLYSDGEPILVFLFPSAYPWSSGDRINVSVLEEGVGWSGRYLRG